MNILYAICFHETYCAGINCQGLLTWCLSMDNCKHFDSRSEAVQYRDAHGLQGSIVPLPSWMN